MPKLKDRPPKYCKVNGQAVVYHNGGPTLSRTLRFAGARRFRIFRVKAASHF